MHLMGWEVKKFTLNNLQNQKKVGFTDDNGGLVIALNPNNDTSSSSGDSASRHQQNANSDQDQNAIAAVSRSQILYAPVWISIAVGLALIIP